MKKFVLNIFVLLFTFNVLFLGQAVANSPTNHSSSVANTTQIIERVEVPLNSFSSFGIVIMIALSSLVGAFFLRDEVSSVLE